MRNRAVAVGAAEWLERLAALVQGLEDDWTIVVGRPYEGGSEAFVAEATCGDGTPAVLKVLMPHGGGWSRPSSEATALRLAGGDGCPVLYRYDPDRGALLMERLGRPMYELGLPLSRRLELLCDTAARVWTPAADCGLPTGAEKARWLADFILNALQSGSGFKLVDPEGLLAEAEYDLGVLMRGDPVELLAGDPVDRAFWLAGRTGLDPVATWEWGVVERLSTGLVCTRIQFQPLGSDTLRAVEAVAGMTIG